MAGVDREAAAAAAARLRFSMIATPGGTFRMGVDAHYREEVPVCRITADPVRIDAAPAANHPFKDDVRAKRRFAFYSSPRSVDLRDKHQGRQLLKRAGRQHPCGPKDNINSHHGPMARHTKPADTPTCRVGFGCVVRQQGIE